LQSPTPQVRFQGVVDATRLPPAQAIPMLQAAAAQQQDPQLAQLAQRAISVMQQMPGGVQPQPQQNTNPYQQQQQNGYTPPGNNYAPQPYTSAVAVQGNLTPQNASLMLSMIASDLTMHGDAVGVDAVHRLAGLAQSNPSSKNDVIDLLLNKVYNYNISGPVEVEAVRLLASFNEPRLTPYMAAIARDTGRSLESRQIAEQSVGSAQSTGAQTAGVNGGQANIDWLRLQETKLVGGGQGPITALSEMRKALGPDPTAQGPARMEVMRILLTFISGSHDENTMTGAVQLLGQMKAKEMDSLLYLNNLVVRSDVVNTTKDAAKAAMGYIMQP
jgi:hypothetical protein